MKLGTSSLDTTVPSSAIDGETMDFGIWPKKPMISKAPFFVGVADGIVLSEKYFNQQIQMVRMIGNNRMGMTKIRDRAAHDRGFIIRRRKS